MVVARPRPMSPVHVVIDSPSTTPVPSAMMAINLPLGETISLFNAASGYYVSTDLSESHHWLRCLYQKSTVGDKEKFTLEDAGEGYIAIKASNSSYVTCDTTDYAALRAMGAKQISESEKFQCTDLGNGNIVFRAKVNGKYIKADPDDTKILKAMSDSITEWETFRISEVTATKSTVSTTDIKINDNTKQAVYVGNWVTAIEPDYLNADEHYSNVPNASVTFTFIGTRVSWIGGSNSEHGTANVSVDNGPVVTVNTYSVSTLSQQTLFTKSGLKYGKHTLKIVVTSGKAEASTDCYQDVDGFLVQ